MPDLLFDDHEGARKLPGDITDHGADVIHAPARLTVYCRMCGEPGYEWCATCLEIEYGRLEWEARR